MNKRKNDRYVIYDILHTIVFFIPYSSCIYKCLNDDDKFPQLKITNVATFKETDYLHTILAL